MDGTRARPGYDHTIARRTRRTGERAFRQHQVTICQRTEACGENLLEWDRRSGFTGRGRIDGRVAEGDGLLNRYTAKSRIGGSNPPLSATQLKSKNKTCAGAFALNESSFSSLNATASSDFNFKLPNSISPSAT